MATVLELKRKSLQIRKELLTMIHGAKGGHTGGSLSNADILTAPLSYTATWDHRPDLTPSGVACDPEVARRALQ